MRLITTPPPPVAVSTRAACRARAARSIEASQPANSAAAATTSARPPKPHMTAPAICWLRTAVAPCPYGAYHDVAASVMRSPSAVAGSVAMNTPRTPRPRRSRRPAPSTIHQNNVAVATNDTCSATCTPSLRTAASYSAGRCHTASVSVRERRTRTPSTPASSGSPASAAPRATPAAPRDATRSGRAYIPTVSGAPTASSGGTTASSSTCCTMCAGRFVVTAESSGGSSATSRMPNAPANASACSGVTMRPRARDPPQRREATRVDQRAGDHHEEEGRSAIVSARCG